MRFPIESLPLWITPILFLVSAAYLRSLVKKIDSFELVQQQLLLLKEQITGLKAIKEEWIQIRMELTKLIVEMEHMKKSQDDVVVMKRDLHSIWKNIDKLKDAMFDEEYRGSGGQ